MKINYEQGTHGYLDITFGPKWDYVPLTKNYVENFLLINLIDKENIGKIAISASELLENAVKYSSKDGIRMIIRKILEKRTIELLVMNFTTIEMYSKVKDIVDVMNSSDPMEYYIKKMKEAAISEEGESGLGLARINYECGAKISIGYSESDAVIVVKSIFDID